MQSQSECFQSSELWTTLISFSSKEIISGSRESEFDLKLRWRFYRISLYKYRCSSLPQYSRLIVRYSIIQCVHCKHPFAITLWDSFLSIIRSVTGLEKDFEREQNIMSISQQIGFRSNQEKPFKIRLYIQNILRQCKRWQISRLLVKSRSAKYSSWILRKMNYLFESKRADELVGKKWEDIKTTTYLSRNNHEK